MCCINCIGIVKETSEFDPLITTDTWIRCPASTIFGGECIYYFFKVICEVEWIEWNAKMFCNTTGIESICNRAAALVSGLGIDASTIGSAPDEDGKAGCPCRIKTPIQSCPASTSNEAVTLESTPPDMAMTMRDMKISLTKSLKGLFQ